MRLVVLFLICSWISPSFAQESAPADSSDAAFIERLQRQSLVDFPEELWDFDESFRDSVVALHDSVGLKELAKDQIRQRRRFDMDFGLGTRLPAYHRVEGLVASGRLEVSPLGPDWPTLEGEAGWAFGSEEFRHSSEVEFPLGDAVGRLTLGYREDVTPFGSNRVFGNSLRTLIGGSDDQDYLKRNGAFARWTRRHRGLRLSAAYEVERQSSMPVATRFSLVGNPSRPNPQIDEGVDRSLLFRVGYGEREFSRFQTWIRHRIGGGALEGQWDYQRTDALLRARHYLGRQEFIFRTHWAHVGGAPPMQQLADIGGLGQLRGFDPRWQLGRSSATARIEAPLSFDLIGASRIPLLGSLGLQLVPWADTARVFQGSSEEWYSSAGMGIQRFIGIFGPASNLRLDLILPLGPERPDDFRWNFGFGGMF